MKIESDTYAIIKYRGKPKLAYVLNGKSRKAVLNDSLCTDEPINFTFDADQVMCALGDAPEQGTLYGVKVEPFLKTVETEKYGPIHFFRYMKPREKEALKTAMRAVYEFYQKNISVDFLPLNGLFIRNAKGKYAGSYKAMTRANEWKDQITFHPKDFSVILNPSSSSSSLSSSIPISILGSRRMSSIRPGTCAAPPRMVVTRLLIFFLRTSRKLKYR